MSSAGHVSTEDHLAWIQMSNAVHHQPAWRVSDRAPADSAVLAGEGGSLDPSGLPDVNFRVDEERGRVVWTIDGEDFTKQFYPPNLRALEFTPHSLIGEMDYAGVDVALLHVDVMLGRSSEFQAECVKAYPDRLLTMAPVDEWRVASETDACIEELRRAVEDLGLHAIKFNPPHAHYLSSNSWDSDAFRPFWDAATSLGVPIFFTLGCGSGDESLQPTAAQQRRGYLGELRILTRWMERYPDTLCSITHGFPWRLFVTDDGIALPEEIWEPFRNPRLNLEVCFPVRIGDLFDFPYREVWPTLEQMVGRIGTDRLLWGTDMPFQNRFCTYRQSRCWIEGYCDFLDDAAKAYIMGGAVARVLGLKETA